VCSLSVCVCDEELRAERGADYLFLIQLGGGK
jgi:hypothetical protein